jgi:hypothetical protein
VAPSCNNFVMLYSKSGTLCVLGLGMVVNIIYSIDIGVAVTKYIIGLAKVYTVFTIYTIV